MPKKLHTIIFERSGGKDTMIRQISGRDSSDVVASWIHLLSKQSSMSKEEKEDLLEELEYSETIRLTDLINAWCNTIIFQKGVYTVNVVQTTTNPTASVAFRASLSTSPQVEGAYEHYRREYLKLKNCDARNSKIDVARRRAERWMRYWGVKEKFLGYSALLKGSKDAGSLYTFVFEYGGGIYISQLWLSDSHSDLVLVAWVEKMLQEVGGLDKPKKIIDKEVDRLLLMERAMDENYYPEPISGLVNVWSTYFTLSKGLGNLTIVKTYP